MTGVYTVTQVTAYIRNIFTQDFAPNHVSIEGEVSNCEHHTSGHIYFTLRDGGSQIVTVMFAGQRKELTFRPKEGQGVTITGNVDIYKRGGRYQLYAKGITKEGRSDLFARFEKLRNGLEDMDMFDGCYKQLMLKYALRVEIVTTSTEAAIRGIMNTSTRRNPYVQLAPYPALVQGERAKPSIVRGIEALDRMGLDVIIVSRGGGSIEDLWAFNEETMAKIIFDSTTLIISAVGHETDVTITDYVAGLRAPTPPAAAEPAMLDLNQFEEQVKLYSQVLNRSMKRKVKRLTSRLKQGKMRLMLHGPGRQLVDRRQRPVGIENQMGRIVKERLGSDERHPTGIEKRLSSLIEGSLKAGKHRLALGTGRSEALSPLKELSAGYGFVADIRGNAVRTVTQTKPENIVGISVRDGRIEAQVEHMFENRG